MISEVDINDWDRESQEAYLKWAEDYGLDYEPWIGQPDVAAAWKASAIWVLEHIQNEFNDSVMADLEHGVKCLNEKASNDFHKGYPNLSKFWYWLNQQGEV